MVKGGPDFWGAKEVYTITYDFVPSDVLRKSDDAEAGTLSTSYVKMKSIVFYPEGPIGKAELRIKFDLKATSGETASGRIYRNGVAIGTERSTTSTTYVTYTEDIKGWKIGDTIELWAKSYPGTYAPGATVRNFRVYADIVKAAKEASW